MAEAEPKKVVEEDKKKVEEEESNAEKQGHQNPVETVTDSSPLESENDDIRLPDGLEWDDIDLNDSSQVGVRCEGVR